MSLKITEFEIKPVRTRSRYRKPGKLYVFLKNETILENLLERRNRPVEIFRKLAKQALKENGWEATYGDELKLRWSQKAGCSCGCSPGFYVNGNYNLFDKDIFVTVE